MLFCTCVDAGAAAAGTGGVGFTTGTHSDSLALWCDPLETGNVSRRVACWACFSTGVSTGSCLAFWEQNKAVLCNTSCHKRKQFFLLRILSTKVTQKLKSK